jgi:hypothetical protein
MPLIEIEIGAEVADPLGDDPCVLTSFVATTMCHSISYLKFRPEEVEVHCRKSSNGLGPRSYHLIVP